MYWKWLVGLLGIVAAAGGGWALYKRGKNKGEHELDEEIGELEDEVDELLGRARVMQQRFASLDEGTSEMRQTLKQLHSEAVEIENGFGAINRSITALEAEIAEITNRDQDGLLPGASPA